MKNPQTVSNSHPKPGLGSQKIQVRSLESVCWGFGGWLGAQLRTSQGSGRHGVRSSPLLFTHLYQAIVNAPHSTAHTLQEGKPQGRRIRCSVQVAPGSSLQGSGGQPASPRSLHTPSYLGCAWQHLEPHPVVPVIQMPRACPELLTLSTSRFPITSDGLGALAHGVRHSPELLPTLRFGQVLHFHPPCFFHVLYMAGQGHPKVSDKF